MIRKISFIILSILCIQATLVHSQTTHNHLRNGDMLYGLEMYDMAEQEYRKAENAGPTFKGAYNLGNALYKQERFEEAAEQFNNALSKAENSLERSLASYNLANAYVFNQKLDEAIHYYKETIRTDPGNIEAKYNLTRIKHAKLEQQQQQQQQQQSDEQQDGEEGEEGEQQENQEQQPPQEGEQQDSTQQEQSPQDSLSEENMEETALDSSRLDKSALDSLDAIKLLDIIANEEQKVQEKLKKFNSNRKKSDKEW